MTPDERRQGYVRRWRCHYDSPEYRDLVVWRVRDYLETHVNWKAAVLFDGSTILPGQIVTSRENLARETGLSVQQVRSALDRLKTRQTLTIKTTKRYTLITLTNWIAEQTDQDLEQPGEQPDKQPSDNPTPTRKQPDSNPTPTTIKKGNQGIIQSRNDQHHRRAREREPRTKGDDVELTHYQKQVLELLKQRTGTPRTLSVADQRLCDQWESQGITPAMVGRAIVLGCLRKHTQAINSGGKVRMVIGSLNYFAEIIQETQDPAKGAQQWEHEALRLKRIESGMGLPAPEQAA